ncbi:MAG: EAL domain-containing protein, partial [Actinomycetota bacterium]|nr:EAL domain-containing protein [Actinomycetota bacterium]
MADRLRRLLRRHRPQPYPSVADLAYLSFYPFTYAGLLFLMRRRLRRLMPRRRRWCGPRVSLAHSLGLTMVGEGIEPEGVLRQLEAFGCDQAQGLHLARPMPAA